MEDNKPLVSVGIPTYNRPEGLRRTLACITGQTYRNLEIIVSDNCSPDSETEMVVREFMSKDSRIQYFCQVENKGAAFNFKFVLEKATGEYFMWAADDDEWSPNFVTTCLKHIGENASSMPQRTTVIRGSGMIRKMSPPPLDRSLSSYKNGLAFLRCMDPCLIYGLHKRATILRVLNEDMFDFWDCYFVFKQVIDYGYSIAPGEHFVAGIDGNDYIKKPFHPLPSRLFQYSPFYKACLRTILGSENLNRKEKAKLIYVLTETTIGLFWHHEREVRPLQAELVRYGGRILSVVYTRLYPIR